MAREALFVQGSWFKDEWTDLAIYAIRADQWCANGSPTGPSPV
jgi:RimJ/RimL family protein N-acetyltransferase